MIEIAEPESRTIAIRAYARTDKERRTPTQTTPDIISRGWTLTFDTETTTDASQQLRFGCYQLRHFGTIKEIGVFYDPLSLTDNELAILNEYAKSHAYSVLTCEEYVDKVFIKYVYNLNALCIGFNLPFDLSRIAIGHSPARGRSMRGGFTFQLTNDKRHPHLRIKHLSQRAALIQFAAPAQRSGGRPKRRGYFVDVNTLATTLLSSSFNLSGLARHLDTTSQKLDTNEHGNRLTLEYLTYAMQDVQVTWECFDVLKKLYKGYRLTGTPIYRLYSEASLGKAYFRQMGIRPWKELQPDFPSEILGNIMSTYFGGRAEVHNRREVAQVVYCDFMSMYPSVGTLMNLWQFVTADGMESHDTTEETRRMLNDISLSDLQKREVWRQIHTIVSVQPQADIFPIRVKYDETSYSIGVNYLTSIEPVWYTLADCIASKLLTGRSPHVIRAIAFRPVGQQTELVPVDIVGKHEYRVDPTSDDFFKRLIELRTEVKGRMKKCTGQEKDHLNAEQQALKICANATSYGIFVEINVNECDKLQKVDCHSQSGSPFVTYVKNTEESGMYFHPLLGTLLTAAARLMLAITERLIQDQGLTWAFCDTDSMAIGKPLEMGDDEFLTKSEAVISWFTSLYPYAGTGSLLKVEDQNYSVDESGHKIRVPLYCYAISAKRYALFNIDQDKQPILRKASAHGLGHLRPPCQTRKEIATENNIPDPITSLFEIGVERWQYDYWHTVLTSVLRGEHNRIQLNEINGFGNPAVSRYSATTTELLAWFKTFNLKKPYRDQVKPFNFLLVPHTKQRWQLFTQTLGRAVKEPEKEVNVSRKQTELHPVAPFNSDPAIAVRGCFDRVTGEAVPANALLSYREALLRYHLHPEAKFHDGDYSDYGQTRRRHVQVTLVEYIGKEANRWEQQYFVGRDGTAEVQYGTSPKETQRRMKALIEMCSQYKMRELSRASDLSVSEISDVLNGKKIPGTETVGKLQRGIEIVDQTRRQEKKERDELILMLKQECAKTSIRAVAERVDVDPANFAKFLAKKQKGSNNMQGRLFVLIASLDSLKAMP